MIRFLSLICLLFICLPASAQSVKQEDQESHTESGVKSEAKSPTADFSKAKHTKSGRIDKIIDSLTIELKDGTIVRLASLNIADFHIWENAPIAEAALLLLKEKLPERTEVMLYQTRDRKKGRMNRMEHQLAHIIIKEDKTWIQGLLLANGLAHVYTAPTDVNMLTDMYKAEQSAREAKRGMWEDGSEHSVLAHDQTKPHIGDFAIIEGMVQKAASVRNSVYLNFGKDWKTDFTIQISPALRKKFSKEGVNVLNLAHQSVRVRGILREYNGPLIELEDTIHLEILQKPSKTPKLSSDFDKEGEAE